LKRLHCSRIVARSVPYGYFIKEKPRRTGCGKSAEATGVPGKQSLLGWEATSKALENANVVTAASNLLNA
jgi:hypothetical protein